MGRKSKGTAQHTADTSAVPGIRGFAGIPRCVIESEAYRHLGLIDRAILVEIVARMRGDNNGAIHISYAEIARALNRKDQKPIGPAIARLMQHGLLDIGSDSVWKERRAREYRLTFASTSDSLGRPIRATNDYLKWTPERKNDATYVTAAKRKSVTPFIAGKKRSATNGVAASTENCGKLDTRSATNGVIPILLPSSGPEIGDTDQGQSGAETSAGRFQAEPIKPASMTDDEWIIAGRRASDTPDMEADELRGRVKAFLAGQPRGAQSRLAERLDMPAATMSRFIHGSTDLDNRARIAIACALGRAINQARAA